MEVNRPWLAPLVLALICSLYLGVGVAPVIFDDNEGLYADAAKEMANRGDWTLPLSNGFPRVQKPPLIYVAMLVSTTLFGWSEWALRLPNALATCGWIGFTFLIARRIGGEALGLASAAVLASMLGVWIFTHLIQPEPFLACFISMAIWALLRLEAASRAGQAGARGDVLLFWLALALGTMSKGLHGALWPLGAAALLAAFDRPARRWLRQIFDWRGLLLFAAIVLPWYVEMTWRLPGFLSAHFLNEQLGASLNVRIPPDARQLPLLQFYLQHLLFWLPWTLTVPAGGALLWARRRQGWGENGTAIRLLLFWLALTLLSVAFSTRQDYYSLSAWGVIALGLAWPWCRGRKAGLSLWYFLVPSLLVLAAGAGALGLYGWVGPQVAHLASPGAEAAPIQERDTFLSAIQGISPALWSRFLGLLAIFGVAMVLAGLGASWCSWRRRYGAALGIIAGAMAVPIVLATIGFSLMSPYFSLAPQAAYLNPRLARNPLAIVACEALPNTASSLLYYLNGPVRWVNAPFENQYAQRVLGQGRSSYLSEANLLALWTSGPTVYLICEEARLAHWQDVLPNRPGVRLKSGTRVILQNER